MKQGTLFGTALGAVFALAIAGSAHAGNIDKSSPQLMTAPAASSSSSSSACVDASGKPVTDSSVCASGACVDASGKAVTDASVCDVSAPRDAASGMATGKRQHKPISP
ncbi:hypothetical protein [Emcibacter sp. SYSU 3D8]|uniref:hypothetical protein n=1 Tax=Emcibacter sp. SYSU 3D8 TaxID=3133969 RepID=UPI0031FE6141